MMVVPEARSQPAGARFLAPCYAFMSDDPAFDPLFVAMTSFLPCRVLPISTISSDAVCSVVAHPLENSHGSCLLRESGCAEILSGRCRVVGVGVTLTV